jgi:hypothetical protein
MTKSHNMHKISNIRKIKIFGGISLALLGVGAIVTIPVLTTSCNKTSLTGEDGEIFAGKKVMASEDSINGFLKQYAQTPPPADFTNTELLNVDLGNADSNKEEYTSKAMADYLNQHMNIQFIANSMLYMALYSLHQNQEYDYEIEFDASKVKGEFNGSVTMNILYGSEEESYMVDFSNTSHKESNGLKAKLYSFLYDGTYTTIDLNFSSA